MVRVGIIDSGGPQDAPATERDMARAFLADGSAVSARPDRLGHGTVVEDVIRRACPGAVILHAQVFDDRPVTSAVRVGAALRWFAAMSDADRPDVICMSLGLAADRAPLRQACALLVGRGAVLVAASPARGTPGYPAGYPGVIAATGDARCGWNEVSQLGPSLFGAWCNSPEAGGAGMGGASISAARISGHLAALCGSAGRLSDARAAMLALAPLVRHQGPEHRAPEHRPPARPEPDHRGPARRATGAR